MRKFSRYDLLNNAAIDGAGRIINSLFESRYVRLTIKIPEYEYKRGQILVSDVNELIEEESFTIEQLLGVLYLDFIKQVRDGANIEQLGKVLIRKMQEQREEQMEINKEFQEIDRYSWVLKERINRRKHKMATVSFKVLKKTVLRGEVLLHDLAEIYPELNLTVEDLISIHYLDFMKEVKSGNPNIVKKIVNNLPDVF